MKRNSEYPLPDDWKQVLQELPDVEIMFCIDDMNELMRDIEKENTLH